MAGLLTCFCCRRLPGRIFQWHRVIVCNVARNLQQRDCPGFTPDSLLIAFPEEGERTVNNENADKEDLYTKPEQVYNVYKALHPISPNFSIAAAFGNCHGLYAGDIALRPEILADHQKYTREQIGCKEEKPLFLVFHGGSGSTVQEFHTGIDNGVVKVNLDTDCQYAYLTGIRDYILNKKDYIMSPVGNPEGPEKPNKKFFDPRVWVREGEKTMGAKITKSLETFRTTNTL